jgi:hypothetical protein
VIAAYLRSNTQHHGNGSIGGSPHECDWALFDHASWKDDGLSGSYGSAFRMALTIPEAGSLEREGAASLFGLKRRNYFLKDTFSKALI